MAISHTVVEAQTALKYLGYDPGEIDGAVGPKTSAAIAAFQAARKLTVNGNFDPATLAALFPSSAPASAPRNIQATLADYALNFLKSKTVWAAGALAALIIGWVQTKFGMTLPPETQAWVTTGLTLAGTALIGVLQTFFNSPHLTTKQPAVVKNPAEFK